MKVSPDLAVTLATAIDEGSLDAAARALHLTQSAVSQRIATLERLTGQVLLVRSRPVRATAAGEAVLRYARQLAHLDDDIARSLGLVRGAPASLALAVNADSLATWLLPALAEASTTLGVALDLRREDESHTASLLADGAVVAAVTTRATAVPGCSVTPLGTLTYRAVAARGFARRWFPGGTSPTALATAPVVDFDRRDDLQTRFLAAHGVDPSSPPRHRVPSSQEFAQAIAWGMGWGMLPDAQRAGLDLVDLDGPPIGVSLHWQQWRTHSALLDDVAARVLAVARAHLSPET